jgi:hypothetical protein
MVDVRDVSGLSSGAESVRKNEASQEAPVQTLVQPNTSPIRVMRDGRFCHSDLWKLDDS